MMNIGLSTLLFPGGGLQHGLKLANKLDIESIEIILDAPHFPPNPTDLEIKEVRESIKDFDFDVRAHGRFWDLNPVSLYQEMRGLTLKQTEKSIELCEKLGGDVITIHPGRTWFRENKKWFRKCEDWFEDYLKKISEYGQERGVKISIETGSHGADYPKEPSLLKEYVEKNDNLGVTLDIGHMNILANKRNKESGVWISEIVESLGKNLFNVHIHDNDGLTDGHLPPGQGNINFKFILESLKKEYDGPLILELWDLQEPEKQIINSVERVENQLYS